MKRKKAMSEESKEPKRIQPGFKIDEDLWYELKRLALDKRQAATKLMEEAIKEYLKRETIKMSSKTAKTHASNQKDRK